MGHLQSPGSSSIEAAVGVWLENHADSPKVTGTGSYMLLKPGRAGLFAPGVGAPSLLC